MQNPTGLAQRESDLSLLHRPVLVEESPVLILEALQLPLFLEGDFELRKVEILCVAEALEKEPVHDLGKRLVAATNTSVRRYVEDDRVGWDLFSNGLEQDLDLLVASALSETLRS